MTTATITMTQPDTDPLSPSFWTTPQELTLLQSLVHWKPVGMHKHFRMMAIHDAMLKSATIPAPVSDHPHASTIPGLWRKLESLYDLKALDEREDATVTDVFEDVDDDGDEDEPRRVEYWREFELKGDRLESEMWDRRLAADGEDEDWSDVEEVVRKRESTIGDSEDPRSSPIDAGSVRGTRSSGRRAAAGRRLAEMKQESSVKGGSRRASKAASSGADEDTKVQAADAQDENEDGSEDNEDESEQEETEDDRRGSKASRGRGGRRGRGRRGRRGK